MNDLLSYLNSNSGGLSVLFTAIVTTATAIYAYLTWILVKETRRMREAQTEPILEILVQPLDIALNYIRIHIKNIGLGGAYNISFNVNVVAGGEVTKNFIKDMVESGPISKGIRYLGPSLEKYTPFISAITDNPSALDGAIEIIATWTGPTGKYYSAPFVLDFSEIKSEYRLGDPPIIEVANSLKKIADDIHNLRTGFTKLQVDIYTKEDRAIEKAEYSRQIARRREREMRKASQNS